MPKSPAAKAVQSPRGAKKLRMTPSRSPLSRQSAELEAAGGAGSPKKKQTLGGKAQEPATRRSPRTAKKVSAQQSLRSEVDLTPASAKKVQRPAAPTPTRAAAIHAGSAHARTQKDAAPPLAAANPTSQRRTPALRKQPARSPLSKATPAPVVTPAPGLNALVTPATAAEFGAATTLKTHQRRRRSAATNGTAETPGAAPEQHHSKSAAAQTAPAAVGAKRKARSACAAEGAAAASPGTALSPGSRKRRRATMPAGKGVLEVHADPEEIQYWKEVEQEELLTDSGDSSSSEGEEEQQNQQQLQQQQRLATKQ